MLSTHMLEPIQTVLGRACICSLGKNKGIKPDYEVCHC